MYREINGGTHPDYGPYSGLQGAALFEQERALGKALAAQEGITDSAQLSGEGVGPLQPEALEATLVSLTFQRQDLTMLLAMEETLEQTTSTVHEWSTRADYGEEANWVGQAENPIEGDPSYLRNFSFMKYVRAMWRTTDVAQRVTTMVDPRTEAQQAAMIRADRLLNSALFIGDPELIPEQVAGIEPAIRAVPGNENVIDLRGSYPTQQTFREMTEKARHELAIAPYFDLFVSPAGATTLDQTLGRDAQDGQRFMQTQAADGGVTVGFHTKLITTSNGDIRVRRDLHQGRLYESAHPTQVPSPSNPLVLTEGATSGRAPDVPTVAVEFITSADPLLTTPNTNPKYWKGSSSIRPSGVNYRYRVVAGNKWGRSAASVLSADVLVPADGAAKITITPALTGFGATYFEVYAEKEAEDGNEENLGPIKGLGRIGFIKAAGASAVVYVDKNERIPRTTNMFMLDMTSVGDKRCVSMKQLGPVVIDQYARVAPYDWGVVGRYLTMCYYAPQRWLMLTNVDVGRVATSDRIRA